MKDKLFSVFAAMALAGTMVVAQDSPGQSPARPQPPASPPAPPSASQAQPPEQTITGCLVQGSGPSVFLLENAKMSTSTSVSSQSRESQAQADRSSAATTSGTTYVVTAAGASADLKSQLNHQVTIVGTLTPAPSAAAPAPSQSAANQRVNEQALPRITAKSIMKLADTCASAG
jgi:hypothetical protein